MPTMSGIAGHVWSFDTVFAGNREGLRRMAKAPAISISCDRPKTIARLKELLAQKGNELTWYHEVGRLVAKLVPKDRAYR